MLGTAVGVAADGILYVAGLTVARAGLTSTLVSISSLLGYIGGVVTGVGLIFAACSVVIWAYDNFGPFDWDNFKTKTAEKIIECARTLYPVFHI